MLIVVQKKDRVINMQMRLVFSICTLQPPEVLVMHKCLSIGKADFRRKAEVKLVAFTKKSYILVLASNSLEPVKNM